MATAKVTTQVYQLPDEQAKCEQFLEGVRALVAETGAQFLAGSVNNEIDWAEILEHKLEDDLGDAAVESLRQSFERNAKAVSEGGG